jgi:mannosyltransferase OCH1-like enzyme
LKEFNKYYKIPKVINYIWLSDEKFPNSIEKYINKNYAVNFLNNGGWEIKIWGEKDFPEEIKNAWYKKTYESKLWAFCSDYLRLWIIYNYGGFYFDSDIEVIRPIPHQWNLEKNLVLGLQMDGFLECGIFGAEPKNKHIKKLLDWYSDKEFDPDWAILNKSNTLPKPLESIYTAPNLWTRLLLSELQSKEIPVFESDVLSACNWSSKKEMITDNTITIHRFAGSWLPKKTYKTEDFGFK